jgi:hypothetical protein
MVNVRKIGAIATGALFIGATFGMASAVTVPSAFSGSMLASGGVAKAQLVVGADAPGKTADTESAKEIQDAVKAKLAATVGGDIAIEFGSQDLHDNANDNDEYDQVTLTTADDATIISLTTDNDLRYDGNADGDLKDSPEDYTLYTDIYVIDGTNGDIQLAYRPAMDATYVKDATATDIESAAEGEVIKIRGTKYVLTDDSTSDGNFEIGPAITKTLTSTTKDPDNAAVVTGTLKMLFDGTRLVMYDGKSLLDEPDVSSVGTGPYKLTSDDKTSDEFGPYDIYVMNQSTSALKMVMVEKSQKFKIADGEEGVLGYASVKVNNSDFADRNVYFLSDVISLVKGGSVDVPDTYYQLKFTTAKKFDILRKKDSSILSGATVKSATSPGKDFMQSGTKITMSVVGSDISIEFGSQDLHDNANENDEYDQVTLSSTHDATILADGSGGINSTAELRYDGNADGDLKDSPEDYTLYTDIYVIDGSAGDIQLAYKPEIDTTYSYEATDMEDAKAGEVVKIKGTRYVLTDTDTSDLNFEIGPAIVKTLSNTTQDPDNAAVVTGTLKMLYTTPNLIMYDGNSLLDSTQVTGKSSYPYKLTSNDKTSDEFGPYDVYVLNATINSTSVKIAMVEKSQKFKVTDGEEGVLGYSSVKVNNSDFANRDTYFLSDVISLVKGDSVDVPDTYYQLKFTTAKKFDILRKKESTVSSGTKLKTTTSPGKDFLTGNIIVSTTGGATSTEGPTLDIKAEDAADTSMNLVLIGGPVANTLTSDLVENGKSTVDWYNSDGDIEVISSAFKSGKYGIIVAGKERTGTADAANAVAGEL